MTHTYWRITPDRGWFEAFDPETNEPILDIDPVPVTPQLAAGHGEQPIMTCDGCGKLVIRTQRCVCGTWATDGETYRSGE